MNDAQKMIAKWSPTKIHFGEGVIGEIGRVIKKHSSNALVVVGQASVKKSGLMEKISGLLNSASIEHRVVGGVEPNPSKETVYRIAYHLLAGNAGCLVAIGGGSVIDAAKAAAILGTLREGELDEYFGVGMVSKKVKRTMNLIAVPTTSGTGSEITKFSVITDTGLHVKKLIFDEAIVPSEAIVDPELTYSCGRHVTLVSGLDTMTHLIEGYLNTVDDGVDPEANERALTGLKFLFEALPRVVKDGRDTEARKRMSLASTLGGTVLFFKQAGGPHLNSFSWCNVMDHGEACAVMLPYYAAYYAPRIEEKLKTLNRMLGVDPSGNLARDFAEALLNFYKRLEFPSTLKEFKAFSKDLIDKAVRDASQNKMKLEAMPRPVPEGASDKILRTIIDGAYHGTLEDILKL